MIPNIKPFNGKMFSAGRRFVLKLIDLPFYGSWNKGKNYKDSLFVKNSNQRLFRLILYFTFHVLFMIKHINIHS